MRLRFRNLGYPIEIELLNITNGILTMGYYSATENRRYIVQANINIEKNIDIGIVPYGGIGIWTSCNIKNKLLHWLKADALLNQDNVILKDSSPKSFDNYIKQYMYRYQILFDKSNSGSMDLERWKKNNAQLEYIQEVLFDGTHDKLHDGGLLKYHQAGKPKKLAIKWHIGKSEYSAYFWFEEEPIREVFDKFYGAHPDTKTDFIIRIDAENRKYELALYRYGLKEPQIIPENVYQLLVFKNNFEDYHSDNYNKERGAWIW